MKKIPFVFDPDKPVFSREEERQREELSKSEILSIYRENRKALAEEPFYPRYHYVSPAGYLHDPNGLCFWRGKWHLFYQHVYDENSADNLSGSLICWGHIVSDDLIHWTDLPDAIYPGPDLSCWSGAVLVEEGRVIAAYYGLYTGIVVAVSSDPLLLNWTKIGTVIPEEGAPCPIYDPCIFKEGRYYYILSGGSEYDEKTKRNRREEFLFRSEDLRTWEYRHPFLENDTFGCQGDDGSCPYFVDIGTGEDRKKLYVQFSHIAGSKFAVGQYDAEREKFYITGGGKFSSGGWTAGGLHAPSCSSDGKGNAVVVFNMNSPAPGSHPIMSLPQVASLSGVGKNDLDLDVAPGVRSLRSCRVAAGPRSLRAGETWVPDGFSGDCVELRLEAEIPYQRALELKVLCSPDGSEYAKISVYRSSGITNPDHQEPGVLESGQFTVVTADASHVGDPSGEVLPVRPPEVCPVPIRKEETVVLDVFIDKCILEVFVNGRRSLIQSVYPSPNGRGVSVAAVGGTVEIRSLEQWDMASYEA